MVSLEEAHGLRVCLLLGKVRAEREGYVLEERIERKEEERMGGLESLENGIVAKNFALLATTFQDWEREAKAQIKTL